MHDLWIFYLKNIYYFKWTTRSQEEDGKVRSVHVVDGQLLGPIERNNSLKSLHNICIIWCTVLTLTLLLRLDLEGIVQRGPMIVRRWIDVLGKNGKKRIKWNCCAVGRETQIHINIDVILLVFEVHDKRSI